MCSSSISKFECSCAEWIICIIVNEASIWARRTESFTIARMMIQRLIKLQELQSLVAKYCKIRDAKFVNFISFSRQFHLKNNNFFLIFSRKSQICTKFRNFAMLFFPYFTTLRHQTYPAPKVSLMGLVSLGRLYNEVSSRDEAATTGRSHCSSVTDDQEKLNSQEKPLGPE